MNDLGELHPQNPRQGFQFPGVFEITAMGSARERLEHEVVRIITEAGLAVLAEAVRVRPSREGNYVSVTASFTCPSRAKYDEVHAALRAHPHIRWTL
ncbi:MAG: DUF493 family protein [Dokdonella sp.]|uniref:YbeD family protein n=1 Tax=Dokdonella sp. TaxID=2291710 RepID=UPI0025C4B9F1|nr:DUF493 family protein [Dokdonella sp.]MBX3700452.1 DUF493 family protein [Dokdonella sp.]MCW5578256.1 DUF493 family protein [Dokdonella sp.]